LINATTAMKIRAAAAKRLDAGSPPLKEVVGNMIDEWL